MFLNYERNIVVKQDFDNHIIGLTYQKHKEWPKNNDFIIVCNCDQGTKSIWQLLCLMMIRLYLN